MLLSVASPLMSVRFLSVDHLFYYSVVLLAIQRFTTTEKEKYANGLNSNCLSWTQVLAVNCPNTAERKNLVLFTGPGLKEKK